MRRTALFLLTGFALSAYSSIGKARAADEVAVVPAYVTPGKPITLKWYFTGEKVLVAGGRFGKGVVVTGKSSLTDTPRTTTKYTFDVWYKIPAPKPDVPKIPDPKAADTKLPDGKSGDAKVVAPKAPDQKAVAPTGASVPPADPKGAALPPADPKIPAPKIADAKLSDPKPADTKAQDPKAAELKAEIAKPGDPKQADLKSVDLKATDPKPAVVIPQETVLKHVQYTAYAEVWSGIYPPMKAYRDPHGWQVSFLSDWKRDNVPTAAEGSDGLVYLQQEDDSVERVAIAIIPTSDTTPKEVLDKISGDVYAHYMSAKISDPIDLTFNAVPAKLMTFTGMDLSHPGTKTTSVVLAFVRNGRSYVLSARTGSTHFNGRRPILEKVLRSFEFTK